MTIAFFQKAASHQAQYFLVKNAQVIYDVSLTSNKSMYILLKKTEKIKSFLTVDSIIYAMLNREKVSSNRPQHKNYEDLMVLKRYR